MTTNTEKKSSKKKDGFFKFLLIVVVLGVIATLITGLVKMFLSLGLFGGDFDTQKLLTSSYILYGAAGAIPLLLMPTLFLWVFSKRKTLMSNVKTSFKVRGIGPYASGFQFSGVKKAKFCEYCGYEVRTGERECPECGGPVRNITL